MGQAHRTAPIVIVAAIALIAIVALAATAWVVIGNLVMGRKIKAAWRF